MEDAPNDTEEVKCRQKLAYLQKYIPFVNDFIVQLRDPRKKNREPQLKKMISLHAMITGKKKDIKLDTLEKCEDVILKLYDKMKHNELRMNVSDESTQQHSPSTSHRPFLNHNRDSRRGGDHYRHHANVRDQDKNRYSISHTPRSPSPVKMNLPPAKKPVVIPIEKIAPQASSGELDTIPLRLPRNQHQTNRIDIYSSAADSLANSMNNSSSDQTNRLTAARHLLASVRSPARDENTDSSSPPTNTSDPDHLSLKQLTALREKLQRQLESDCDSVRARNNSIQQSHITDLISAASLLGETAPKLYEQHRENVHIEVPSQPAQKPSVFTRLADKYNPKPRRPSIHATAPSDPNNTTFDSIRPLFSSAVSPLVTPFNRNQTNQDDRPHQMPITQAKVMPPPLLSTPLLPNSFYPDSFNRHTPHDYENASPYSSDSPTYHAPSLLPTPINPNQSVPLLPTPLLPVYHPNNYYGDKANMQRMNHWNPPNAQRGTHFMPSGNHTTTMTSNMRRDPRRDPRLNRVNRSSVTEIRPLMQSNQQVPLWGTTNANNQPKMSSNSNSADKNAFHSPLNSLYKTKAELVEIKADTSNTIQLSSVGTPAIGSKTASLTTFRIPKKKPETVAMVNTPVSTASVTNTSKASSTGDKVKIVSGIAKNKTEIMNSVTQEQGTDATVSSTTSNNADLTSTTENASDKAKLSTAELEQINKILENVLGRERSKAALGTVLKTITELKDEEDTPSNAVVSGTFDSINKKEEDTTDDTKSEEIDEATPPVRIRGRLKRRKSNVFDSSDEDIDEKVSVSESKRDKRGHSGRTELAKLQKDLDECFDRDGVLNANGKRMSRTVKRDNVPNCTSDRSTEKTKATGSKRNRTTAPTKTIKEVSVSLSKLDLEQYYDEIEFGKRYPLRSNKSDVKYSENEIERDSSAGKKNPKSVGAEGSNSETINNSNKSVGKPTTTKRGPKPKARKDHEDNLEQNTTKGKNNIGEHSKTQQSRGKTTKHKPKSSTPKSNVKNAKKGKNSKQTDNPKSSNVEEAPVLSPNINPNGISISTKGYDFHQLSDESSSDAEQAHQEIQNIIQSFKEAEHKFSKPPRRNTINSSYLEEEQISPVQQPKLTITNAKRKISRSKSFDCSKELNEIFAEYMDYEEHRPLAMSTRSKTPKPPKAAPLYDKDDDDYSNITRSKNGDISETSPIANSSNKNCKPTIRKRSKAWASGVIPKKRKGNHIKHDDSVDTDNQSKSESYDLTLVEPDKNYYYDKSSRSKFACKLCSFDGRDITNHYKFEHPECEILCSRLPPERAEIAIRESEDFDLVNAEEPDFGPADSYSCKFCDRVIRTCINSFFDHCTLHTGEYRWQCGVCSYSCASIKTLRQHCNSSHAGKGFSKAEPRCNNNAYAYLCTACNFVQFDKDTVDSHVNIFHLGDEHRALKISLSDYLQKNQHKRVAIVSPIEMQPIIKEEIEQVVDMTVFQCQQDDTEEDGIKEQQDAEERLRNMTETDSEFSPSLNFIDQLNHRFMTENTTTTPNDDETERTVSGTPAADDESSKTVSSKPTLSTIINTSQFCSSQKVDLDAKKRHIVGDTIEKLKESINNRKEDDAINADPGIHAAMPSCQTSSDSNHLLSTKYISVFRHNDGSQLTFVCRIPPCRFNTASQNEFALHWSNGHSSFNEQRNQIQCDACGTLIDEKSNIPLLSDYFSHIIIGHNNELTTTKSLKSPKGHNETIDDNPFTFKISEVMSLAADNEPIEIDDFSADEEPASTASPSITTVQTVLSSPAAQGASLVEKIMNSVEKAVPVKSQDAIRQFLLVPHHLYKCPNFFCLFSSEKRDEFEQHITDTHSYTINMDQLLPCVYCRTKMPINHAPMHIDLRHSACAAACPKCLYRSLYVGYVVAHMQLLHSLSEISSPIMLEARSTFNQDAAVATEATKVYDIREVCKPYVCGQLDCSSQFVFADDFMAHLKTTHTGLYSCGFQDKPTICTFRCARSDTMVRHWRDHACHLFHCLRCPSFGCEKKQEIFRHCMLEHASFEPKVIYRRKQLSQINYCAILGYDDESLAHLQYPTAMEIIQGLMSDDDDTSTNETESRLEYQLKEEPNFADTSYNSDIPPPPADTSFENEMPDNEASENVATTHESEQEVESPETNKSDNCKVTGLVGEQLYRCASCNSAFDSPKLFRMHMTASTTCFDRHMPRPFNCIHCTVQFRNVRSLIDHIGSHGKARFICSLCDNRFLLVYQARHHLKVQHNVNHTTLYSIASKTLDIDGESGLIMVKPKSLHVSASPKDADKGEEPISGEGKSTTNRSLTPDVGMSYGPNNIDKLPPQQIFSAPLKCALCSFETKVRLNLVRHLVMHDTTTTMEAVTIIPESAPVNPVPCLDKNEKMFDKMTNYALSSIIDATKQVEPIPIFIPMNKRFVCSASSCTYLCLQESMLMHHFRTLHSDDVLTCPHCSNVTTTNVPQHFGIKGMVNHLRLHGPHVFKCDVCSTLYPDREEIKRHITDSHPKSITSDRSVNFFIYTIRSMDEDRFDTGSTGHVVSSTPNSDAIKPWCCTFCKCRYHTETDIRAHAQSKHSIDTQYKCALCSFKGDVHKHLLQHYDDQHPNQPVDILEVFYKIQASDASKPILKDQLSTGAGGAVGVGGGGSGIVTLALSSTFDTTPLWQRDRPRVRHIRGILFDESGKVTSSSTKVSAPAAVIPPHLSSAVAIPPKKELKKKPQPWSKPTALVTNEATKMDTDFEPVAPVLARTVADLVCKYGPLQTVSGQNQFICPLCDNCKTRNVLKFIFHLMCDLQHYRFKCMECNLHMLTEDLAKFHLITRHKNVGNFMPLHPNGMAMLWMQILIQNQCQEFTLEVPRSSLKRTSEFSIPCLYCHLWFSKYPTLLEHQLTHWARPTFTCTACCTLEMMKFDDILDHVCREHKPPVLNSTYDETRRSYLTEAILVTGAPSVAQHVDSIKCTVDHTFIGGADSKYACVQCPRINAFSSQALGHLFEHFKKSHSSAYLDFKYTVVAQQEADISQTVPLADPGPLSMQNVYTHSPWMYACEYCHKRGSMRTLVNHHDLQHSQLKFSYYRFVCGDCSVTYRSNKDFKQHYNEVHPGRKVHFICIENNTNKRSSSTLAGGIGAAGGASTNPANVTGDAPPDSTASGASIEYRCSICTFSGQSMAGIKNHMRHHIKPVKCYLCDMAFHNIFEARSHHTSVHGKDIDMHIDEDPERMRQYHKWAESLKKTIEPEFTFPVTSTNQHSEAEPDDSLLPITMQFQLPSPPSPSPPPTTPPVQAPSPPLPPPPPLMPAPVAVAHRRPSLPAAAKQMRQVARKSTGSPFVHASSASSYGASPPLEQRLTISTSFSVGDEKANAVETKMSILMGEVDRNDP